MIYIILLLYDVLSYDTYMHVGQLLVLLVYMPIALAPHLEDTRTWFCILFI